MDCLAGVKENAHAAPSPSSVGPPKSTVLASEDSATLKPSSAPAVASLPTSLGPCWLQTEPARVYSHAAPRSLLSWPPPTKAVFPSADSPTANPCAAAPLASLPTSFVPCWAQVAPDRVYAHAAPTSLLSPGAPTSAVLPSFDNATLKPWAALPVASLARSFEP